MLSKLNLWILLFISSIGFSQFAEIKPWTYNSSINIGYDTYEYEAWAYEKTVNSKFTRLPFRMIKPTDYNPNDPAGYPLILMFHGRGEAGTDNQRQLLHGSKIHRDAVRNTPQKFPGIVVFPQEPFGSWTNNFQFNWPGGQGSDHFYMALELIDSLIKKLNVDPNRIYVHGLSSGGTAAWAAIYHRPDLFAAALPMSAPGDLTQVNKIAPIPIWLFQGGVDTNPIPFISQQMIAALREAGAIDDDTRYTEYPNQGHAIWNNAYNNADFFPFMLRQSKNKLRVMGINPICPGESVTIALSANMAAYEWYRNNVLITGENGFLLQNVSMPGTYKARFKRTATGPWIESNTVDVTVNVAGNKPTILYNKSLILPSPDANTVTLSSNQVSDQYEWSNGSTNSTIVVSNSGSYTLKVRPANACWSAPSDPIVVRVGANEAGAPNGPANLNAKAESYTSIGLTWTDVSNETGYELYRSSNPGGPYTYVKTLPANTVYTVDTLLLPGTRYYFKVRAINSFGANMSPNEATASTLSEKIAPTIPSSVFVSRVYPNYQGIELSWTASTDNFGVKEYEVFNGTEYIGKTTTTKFFYNPPSRTIYRFFVRAVDASGNKSELSEQLTFAYNGIGLVAHYFEGNWTQVPNFQGMTPLRYGLLNTFTMNSSAPLFNNLLTNTALNSVSDHFGISVLGYVNIQTTGTYTFFTTSDDGSKLYINNQLVVNNDGTHGMQERNGTFNFTSTGWFPIRVDYFDRTGGQGLEVRFQGPGVSKQIIPVERLSYLGTGRDGGVVSNPPWALPTNFVIALNNTNDKFRIKLDWNMNLSANPVAYEIFRADNGSTTVPSDANFRKIATIPANIFTFIDSLHAPGQGLTFNRYYFYRIRALGASGATAFVVSSPTNVRATNPSNAINGTVTNPTGFTATGLTNSVIRLNWTDASNNESGFQISRGNSPSGPFFLVGVANKNTTQWFDSSGVRLTTYYYRIRSFNALTALDTKAWVGPVSATTLGNPSPPSNLTLFVAGDKNINLSWKNLDDVAEGFSIYRSTSAGGPFIRIDSVLNSALNMYQDKNLTPNTTYFYKVRAFNNQLSDFSNTASAKTFIDVTPTNQNWRLPIVANTFSSQFNGNDEFEGLTPRREILKQKLEEGKDFFNFFSVPNNGSVHFSFRLPDASQFPNGGMMTYNVSRPTTEPLVLKRDTLFFRVDNLNYGVRLFLSDDGITYTEQPRPWKGPRGNDLQKIDLPVSYANKYVRVMFENTTGIINFVTEIGIYKFLGPNVRHNYFILTGASIEEQSMPMGLAKFRERIKLIPDLAEMGENLVIFNWAISGSASQELLDSLPTWLGRHPYSGYVMIHQGGNNINATSNNMRPLTYEKRVDFPGVKVFENTFRDFFLKVYEAGKIPFVSRMHFRDYRDAKFCDGDELNGPSTLQGRLQENGSLPYNLLIDSLTKVYAPFAYNEDEKRSGINYYHITLNEQRMIGGDGLHPVIVASSEDQSITTSRGILNILTDYWINHTIRYAYKGNFGTPVQYNPDQQLNWACWMRCNSCVGGQPGDPNRVPANKPNLTFKCDSAVLHAERTKLPSAIWNARVLVEQLGNRALRVSYVNRLDSLQDYRNPVNPQFLQLSNVNSTTLALSWIDNSPNETAFEVWMKTNNGEFVLIATLPANTTSYQAGGLNADNEYSFYIRARNNGFKSGWSNVVTGRPFAIFYSKSLGDLNDLSTWGLAQDGSGDSPVTFSASGQKFVISNRTQNNVLNGNLTISGNNSLLVLAAGQKLTVPSETILNTNIEISEGATLEVLSNTLPNITKLDTTSHVIFGGESTIPSLVYGDLTLTGGTPKYLASNTDLVVKGNLRINDGASLISNTNSSTLYLKKNLTYNDNSSLLYNLNLVLEGNSQIIDAKGGSVKIRNLVFNNSTELSILNSSVLETNGNIIIGDTTKLRLFSGKLKVKGTYNASSKSGLLFTNGGTLEFSGSTPGLKSYIFIDSSQSILYDLVMKQTNGALYINDYVKIKGTLKLDSGVIFTNDNVILESGLQEHGKLGRVGSNASLSGKITSKHLIGPFKKTASFYIGTPIYDQKLASLRPYITLLLRASNSNVSVFNEPTNTFNFILDSNHVLVPGKGYSLVIPAKDFKEEYSSLMYKNEGYPVIGDGDDDNDGEYKIPVSFTNSNRGWNLVANPYPCDINWDNAQGFDKSDIENVIYYYDGVAKQYKVYVGGTGIISNGAGPVILPGQGFMVKAVRNGFLRINEEAKITDNDDNYNFFKSEQTSKKQSSYLIIQLKGGTTLSDQALILFNENGEVNNLDKINGDNGLNVFTLNDENRKLVIQSVGGGQEVNIPIEFTVPSDGKYQITLIDENCRQYIESIYLRDKYLNLFTPVVYGLEKDFEVNADLLSKQGRYELVMKIKNFEKVTSTENTKNQQELLPYPNPFSDKITLQFNSKRNENTTIEVFDLNGSLRYSTVRELGIGSNEVSLDSDEVWNQFVTGTYILKMKTESGINKSYLINYKQ